MFLSRFGARLGAALLALTFCVWSAPSATAQDNPPRSETGRHKPKPQPEPQPEPDNPETNGSTTALVGSRWFVGIGGGLQGGGDLFHVETVNGHAVPWVSAVPFTSSRFNGALDFDANFALFAGRRLSDRWSVRLDLNSSRMDIAAEALQGQQAAVFLYDRLTITTVGLAGEFRLVRLESYPYASMGVTMTNLTAARESELDQQQLGIRLGLGYLKRLDPDFSLRAEMRFSRSAFDIGSFVPQSAYPDQPTIEMDSADRLNIFEIILALQLNL